jgi:hypothetical protein
MWWDQNTRWFILPNDKKLALITRSSKQGKNFCMEGFELKQERKCTYNVKLRYFYKTIVAVEKQ